MNRYSPASEANLSTAHHDLQRLFHAVLPGFDHSVMCGHRPEDKQRAAFLEGASEVDWPDSNHNVMPSKAVDAAPYPIDWHDRERATYFAGYVLGKADEMGIGIRWGGDWDSDGQVKDNKFDDLWHFELVEKEE